MLRKVFIFGVVLPSTVTVVFFVGFMICWFKFNMRERLLSSKFFLKKKKKPEKGKLRLNKPPMASPAKTNHDTKGNGSAGGWGEFDRDGNPGAMSQCTGTRGGVCNPVSEMLQEDVDCCCDPEAALCDSASQEQCIGGLNNPSLAYSTSPTWDVSVRKNGRTKAGLDVEVEKVETENRDGYIFQHTFHFPEVDVSEGKCVACDDHDDDCSNYGHFVPVSELVKDKKMRQFYNRLPQSQCSDISDRDLVSSQPMLVGETV